MNDRPEADNIFDPQKAPRYSEIATFMRTPLSRDIEDVDIALAGVPFDAGATNRPGARHGPREIRNSSSMIRTIHPVTRVNPFELCRVADVGDVRFSRVFDIEAAEREIASFFDRIRAAGALPLAAGGDHSITLPILETVAKKGPVGLIHIDAHTDTWGEFQGSVIHHGSPFRRAVERKLIDPRRTIQIGIRGAQTTTEGWDFSTESGIRVLFMHEIEEMGFDAVIAETRRIMGDGPTYISFDVDGLDPVFAPGTGTPEVGGMTTREALRLLRGLRGLHLVGGDVVEVAPPFDPSGNTALVGATLMYEILCLLVENLPGRAGELKADS
jgi:guanidinopropionase